MSLYGSRRLFVADTVADFPNAHTYADALMLEADTNQIYVSVNGSWVVKYTSGLSAPALPTSDPNTAGALYSIDSAGLAAELAAGSRYVLISNGP